MDCDGMSARMPEERRLLGGRYEIEERIGWGGTSVVYRAMDRRLRRVVAVKRLSARLEDDPAAVERLTREARVAAAVSGSHIVAVLDWGVDEGGAPYLVMEYAPGGDLARHVAGRLPLPPTEVADYGQQIAAALAAAHGSGLIHRDVNPRNVLVDGDGRLKLTDFGIARSPGSATVTEGGVALGTAVAMAPEQATGQPVSPATDVYALGVLLYILATGQPPFRADHDLALLRQHIETDPPPPSQINPAVPDWLERIILRAMAKRPTSRYPDGASIGAALAAGMAGTAGLPSTRPVLVAALRAARPAVAGRAAALVTVHPAWRPASVGWATAVLAASLLALAVSLASQPTRGDDVVVAAGENTLVAVVEVASTPPPIPTAAPPTPVQATATAPGPTATIPAPPSATATVEPLVVAAAPPTTTPVPPAPTATPVPPAPPPAVVVMEEPPAPARHAVPLPVPVSQVREPENPEDKKKDDRDDRDERQENRGRAERDDDDDDDDRGRKPAEAKPAPKPQPKAEVKPASKPQPKADAKPDSGRGGGSVPASKGRGR